MFFTLHRFRLFLPIISVFIVIFQPQKAYSSDETLTTNTPIRVQVSPHNATIKPEVVKLYGMTQARRKVDIKAEVTGKVTDIFVKEGSQIQEGTVILHIELRDLDAHVKEAEALVKQREIEYQSAKKLGKQGLSAESRIAETASLLAQAKGQLIRARIAYDNYKITAPFSGWLEKIHVEVGDLVGPGINTGQGTFNDGVGIVTLIEDNPMLVVGQVSERDVLKIKKGMKGTAKLSSSQQVEGEIRFVGKIADPQTRTFVVELEFPNPDGMIPSGATAELNVPVGEVMAHHLPSSLLVLDNEGKVGVRSVEPLDETLSRVKFYPVTLIASDKEGVWVSGLPNQLSVISRGQQFVTEGSDVIAVEASSDAQPD